MTVLVTMVVPQSSTPQPATPPAQSAQPLDAAQSSQAGAQLGAQAVGQQDLLRNKPAWAESARLTASSTAADVRLVSVFNMG
jgi:hypothetical protein